MLHPSALLMQKILITKLFYYEFYSIKQNYSQPIRIYGYFFLSVLLWPPGSGAGRNVEIYYFPSDEGIILIGVWRLSASLAIYFR